MNLLRQPYPRNETAGHAWRLAGIFGFFVGAFLSIFQPFNLNTWDTDYKLLKIWGFGGITFGIMALSSVLIPRLVPRFFAEERWTVGKQISYVLTQILLIAVANQLYLLWLVNGTYSAGWVWSMGVTLLVGIFPTTGAVLANYIRQLKRYREQAATLSASRVPQQSDSEQRLPPTGVSNESAPTSLEAVKLVAENARDSFTLHANNLLAIESSDNYCTIFYAQKDSLAKALLRSSLSHLESQLADNQLLKVQKSFVRCHRSYLVNLNRVERVSGNAQGYKLHLLDGQLTIPVARKYNDTLLAGLG